MSSILVSRYNMTLMVCVILALNGCAQVQKTFSFIPGIPDPENTPVRSISFEANINVNHGNAVEVDVFFVLDANLLEALPATSPEWFSRRSKFLSNHSNEIIVGSVGLVPGSSASLLMPQGFKKAKEVVLYANYIATTGQSSYRLPRAKAVHVRLTGVEPVLSVAGK